MYAHYLMLRFICCNLSSSQPFESVSLKFGLLKRTENIFFVKLTNSFGNNFFTLWTILADWNKLNCAEFDILRFNFISFQIWQPRGKLISCQSRKWQTMKQSRNADYHTKAKFWHNRCPSITWTQHLRERLKKWDKIRPIRSHRTTWLSTTLKGSDIGVAGDDADADEHAKLLKSTFAVVDGIR